MQLTNKNGTDLLLNEYFIRFIKFQNYILPIIHNLFKKIFKTVFPHVWSESIVVPVHKKDGISDSNYY